MKKKANRGCWPNNAEYRVLRYMAAGNPMYRTAAGNYRIEMIIEVAEFGPTHVKSRSVEKRTAISLLSRNMVKDLPYSMFPGSGTTRAWRINVSGVEAMERGLTSRMDARVAAGGPARPWL